MHNLLRLFYLSFPNVQCVRAVLYNPFAPKWNIGNPQFSSTGLCPELIVQFGTIASLFAAVLVFRPTTISFTLRVPEEYLFSYVFVWFS